MTYITLNNVNIDMGMKTISGDSSEVAPFMGAPLHWAELTDADMCLNRMTDPEQFMWDLLAYCQIRVMYQPGVYSSQSMIPIGQLMLNSYPEISSWAQGVMWKWLPELSGAMVDKVTLYTAGGFKIRVKSHDAIF